MDRPRLRWALQTGHEEVTLVGRKEGFRMGLVPEPLGDGAGVAGSHNHIVGPGLGPTVLMRRSSLASRLEYEALQQ